MEYLSDFIKFLQSTKNLSKKTLNAYSIDLNQYFKYEKDILHPDICAFISFLHDELKLKDSSIRRKIITLKIFYEYLVNLDLIAITPFAKLKFRFKQEQRLPKTLSVTEVSKMLDCFEKNTDTLSSFAKKIFTRDSALMDLLISTGIRIGEAASITIEDIICSERRFLIHGKGRKQRLIYVSSSVTWSRL